MYNANALLLIAVLLIAGIANAADNPKADAVLVKKSSARLYLQAGGKTIATLKVALGAQPQGHKQAQGDERTPEGTYLLDWKNAHSGYYKSIHISYPNSADRARAKLSATDAGGDIMIHGQRNGWGWFAPLTQWFNWTNGCIALSNRDMDIVWQAVDAGTPITIVP